MKKEKLNNLVFSAMFLALGAILPFLTGQIKELGDSFLPMHLPIMLCGAICGAKYGFVTGLILPFLRSLTFGMPPLYPNAVWMALELATYGLVIGILYSRKKEHKTLYLLFCLACSMIAGRIVWGVTKALLLLNKENAFTINAFITGGFIDAIPGIILQFILIPIIIGVYESLKLRGNKQ